MSKINPTEWLESYKKSWRELDAELLVSLFTADGAYQDSPYVMPLQGEQLRTIWDDQKGRQAGGNIDFEIWSVDGDTVIAQCTSSTHWVGKGEQLRNGVVILRFAADGRCRDVRQWYHLHTAGAPLTKSFIENP